jgi:hypothetical protein
MGLNLKEMGGGPMAIASILGLVLISMTQGGLSGSSARSDSSPLDMYDPNGRFIARILFDNDRWVVMEGRFTPTGFIDWHPHNLSFRRKTQAVLFAQDFLDTGYFSDPEKMEPAYRRAHIHRWSDI